VALLAVCISKSYTYLPAAKPVLVEADISTFIVPNPALTIVTEKLAVALVEA
jgi:hypothetical protein